MDETILLLLTGDHVPGDIVTLRFPLPDHDVLVEIEIDPHDDERTIFALDGLDWERLWELLTALSSLATTPSVLHEALGGLARRDLPRSEAGPGQTAISDGHGQVLVDSASCPRTELAFASLSPAAGALVSGGRNSVVFYAGLLDTSADTLMIERRREGGHVSFSYIEPTPDGGFGERLHAHYCRLVLEAREGSRRLIAAYRAGLAWRAVAALNAASTERPDDVTVYFIPDFADDAPARVTLALLLDVEEPPVCLLGASPGARRRLSTAVQYVGADTRWCGTLGEVADQLRGVEGRCHLCLIQAGTLTDDRFHRALRRAKAACHPGSAVEIPTTETDERRGLVRFAFERPLAPAEIRWPGFAPLVMSGADAIAVFDAGGAAPNADLFLATLSALLDIVALDLDADARPFQIVPDRAGLDDRQALLNLRLCDELAAIRGEA